ncbi:hypothetical protein J2X46_001132 [Nocardioides sp. BE266]|uniref:DUF7577 domain-containing protein n=1 Tax=Nocardioides sp. BE266 TaxID=2817725 RepID=UPI002856A819|nr:zinc-ribbon domain-containing protein [Nocardioides sp. BE266]MDR7252156.1 hypothetical protein [Nocardioides sp. BE266]
MNSDGSPGLQNQSTVRTTARVVSVVLLLVGVVLLVKGISAFASEFDDPMASDGPGSILMAGAGGFCIVFGLAAANVGWLRAQASYVAGETVPVIKDSLEHLQAGPYCRQCGTRNDTSATFCDSCGQSLA